MRTSLCLAQTTRETGKKKSKIGHDEVAAATVKSFIMFARGLKRGRAVNLRLVVYRGCSSYGSPHRVKESSSERRRKARRDYSQLKYAASHRHVVRPESSKRVRSLFLEASCTRNHRCAGNCILPVRDTFIMRAFIMTRAREKNARVASGMFFIKKYGLPDCAVRDENSLSLSLFATSVRKNNIPWRRYRWRRAERVGRPALTKWHFYHETIASNSAFIAKSNCCSVQQLQNDAVMGYYRVGRSDVRGSALNSIAASSGNELTINRQSLEEKFERFYHSYAILKRILFDPSVTFREEKLTRRAFPRSSDTQRSANKGYLSLLFCYVTM